MMNRIRTAIERKRTVNQMPYALASGPPRADTCGVRQK